MLQYQIKGVKEIQKELTRKEKKVFPQALKKGLDRTAGDVWAGLKRSMNTFIDRPTPFTKKGLLYKKTTARELTVYIFPKRLQEKYFKWLVFGGTAYERKVVPSREYPLNAYGNLPKNATKQAHVFTGTVRGMYAYFRRRGTKNNRDLQLIGYIPSTRRYTKRWPYFEIGKREAARNIFRNTRKEMDKVIDR